MIEVSPRVPGSTNGRAGSIVVEPLKFVYVGMPKVACTSMKWMVAELAGEDPAHFERTLRAAPTRRQTIHFGARWARAEHLKHLPPQRRAEISTDNGWFLWARVRDPRPRLWSAWQSKLLVRNPAYIRFSDEPWFPRVPEKPEHVLEDFAAFVAALAAGVTGRLTNDPHFGPQTDLLDAGEVADPAIYDLSRSAQFEADFGRHLARFGRTVPARHGNDNETPLQLTAEALGNGVGEALEAIYARDFERFGHFWPDVPRSVPLDGWTPVALRDVATRVQLHARLADLRRSVRTLERRAKTGRGRSAG